VLTGLVYLSQEVTYSSTALLWLFYGIIIFNLLFICNWTSRFVDVLFRMYYKSLKKYGIVKCLLNRRHVDSYEEDLNNYVKKIYKRENSFTNRFGRSRSITGL